jgi:hypothetical protein
MFLSKPFACLLGACLVCFAAPIRAQTPPLQPAAAPAHVPLQYTDANYAQAEKYMPYNVDRLVLHAVEDPVWLADDRMIYRDTGARGETFMLVDPAKGTKQPAFDQAKMAHALQPLNSNAAEPFDQYHLPLGVFSLADHDQSVIFGAIGNRIKCDLSGEGVCRPLDPPQPPQQKPGGTRSRRRHTEGGEDIAPDGVHAVFIRDYNLWLRNKLTGAETQLTFDGVKDFGYATDNAGWTHSDDPIVVWSPDSMHIATFQQDRRDVRYERDRGTPDVDGVEVSAARR